MTKSSAATRAAWAAAPQAAAKALVALFRPGMLGVVVDAVAVAIVAAMPMPLLQKTAFVGAVWLGTIVVSAMVLVPTLLSWVTKPHARAFPFDTNRWCCARS